MVGLVGMIGTAAACPEEMYLVVDGTTTSTCGAGTPIVQPIIIDNTGGTTDFDIQMGTYCDTSTTSDKHTLIVSCFIGTASDLTVTLTERTNTSNTVTKNLGVDDAVLDWYQDQNGDGTQNIVDYIDISISSIGPDGLSYSISIDDDNVVTQEFAGESPNLKNIPEFPTVALPIAAILGLMFIISSRKKKE